MPRLQRRQSRSLPRVRGRSWRQRGRMLDFTSGLPKILPDREVTEPIEELTERLTGIGFMVVWTG